MYSRHAAVYDDMQSLSWTAVRFPLKAGNVELGCELAHSLLYFRLRDRLGETLENLFKIRFLPGEQFCELGFYAIKRGLKCSGDFLQLVRRFQAIARAQRFFPAFQQH